MELKRALTSSRKSSPAQVVDLANISSGVTVYFWGSQWARNNRLSGGVAPSSFKGFVNSPEAPACGGYWSSGPGNSSDPPSKIPEYLGVIVASSVTQNGLIVNGDVRKIIVVKTNPGYGISPGNPGTGQVVAILCAGSRQSVKLFSPMGDFERFDCLKPLWLNFVGNNRRNHG
jgi:hypothetical protein